MPLLTGRIDSPSNPRIRAAAGLRDRRDRERSGLTLVDGGREARRAVEAGVAIEQAFVAPELVHSDDVRAALSTLRRTHGAVIVEVGTRAFEKLAYGDRSDGIVLVVRPAVRRLEALELGPAPLVVITEDVEKPGNVGAILRSADGVGAAAVVAVGGTDLHNPNVIRASIGTVFAMPIVAATADATLAWCQDRGLRVVVARLDAPRLHVDTDLTGALAIVLGSEAEGVSAGWTGPGLEGVRLPMAGVADSLNVSVAAGVLLYEAWRQRQPRGSSISGGAGGSATP